MADQKPFLVGGYMLPNLEEDRDLETVSEVPDGLERDMVFSTLSQAVQKQGVRQMIPKNLATSSRPRPRHHTTVATVPVAREVRPVGTAPSQGPWEDYDSDGDSASIRRNRRNMSYRVAVADHDDCGVTFSLASRALKPVSEEINSTHMAPHGVDGDKKAIRRRTDQWRGGSFKDEPRLYQEILERGLHSDGQGADCELVDEPPGRDKSIVVKSYRPTQVTWSQLPQVQEMGILQNISAEERKRQEVSESFNAYTSMLCPEAKVLLLAQNLCTGEELRCAMFEIITSEFSYQHSLGILVREFRNSAALQATMTPTEHHHLFSNISVIQAVSQRFFEELEFRHQENPVIKEISDIIQKYAVHHFQPYITYCSNEIFQQRTLQKLLSSNAAFKDTLKRIESSMECSGLPIISFLILPMQRVTRLPLLMDTICQKTPENTVEYMSAVFAMKAINKLVKKCNDGARTMERTEQMYTIQKQMDFGKIKPFPLISASRWLLKRGELLVCHEELSIFWKAYKSHKSFYLFLFSDVLIITKKKSEESYIVMDYATVDNVEVGLDSSDKQLPQGVKQGSSTPFTLKLVMKKNSEGRAEQITLCAESQIERARWVTALRKHRQADYTMNKEGLPQYEVIKAYIPKEPDELGLQRAEVVIVLQKEEGWHYGERMRDGEKGWFPASCTTEITDRATVECNVRRMHRLRETNV